MTAPMYSPFSEMSKTADVHSDGLKASLTYLREQHDALRASIHAKNGKLSRLRHVLSYLVHIVPELKTEIDEVCDAIVMTPDPRMPSDEEFIEALKAAYSSPKMLAPPPNLLPEPEYMDVRHMEDIASTFQADMALQRSIPSETGQTISDRIEETRKELEEYTVRYMNH